MSLLSTSIAYASLICLELVVHVETTINQMSYLIASIASSCLDLGLLSCLLCQLGGNLLFSGFNLVGPTLVWTHSPLMSIQATTIAYTFFMLHAIYCVGLA